MYCIYYPAQCIQLTDPFVMRHLPPPKRRLRDSARPIPALVESNTLPAMLAGHCVS